MRARSILRLVAVPTAAVLIAQGAGIAPASSAPSPSSTPSGTSARASTAASSASVAKTTTTITTGTAVAGTPTAVTATVAPTPSGGTVAFTADGASLSGCTTVAVKSGKAICSADLTAGRHALVAKYAGVSGAFKASTGKKTITVSAGGGTTFVGSFGSCTTTKGAVVAVNFGHWGGPAVRGCDPSPTTGIKLLTTAGFTTAGDQHDGPAFICRIGHPLFENGTQYPTPAQDPCVVTPPATAYWSFWLAPKGQNSWTYSPLGAYSDKPKDGEVEAWTFGGTDVAGTTGQPSFTPTRCAPACRPARRPPPASRGSPSRKLDARIAVEKHVARVQAAAGGTADLGAGVNYLVGQLVGGTHYEPFGPGFDDFGLTMDGALALAAAGTDDATLANMTDFVAANADGYTGIGTQYAGGGYLGKEALLAEVTGRDPRAFGGHDLIAAIDGTVCTKAITNVCAAKGNYRYAASTFSQTLAIMAQLRAGDTAGAAAPITYLESLQHSTGAFPSVLPGSDSETDSTGMAAMALALVPGAATRAALAKALSWLAGQQASDGGFPGASGDSVNSAGIVIQALRLDALTYATQITKAQAFLASEQNTDGGFNVAVGAEDNGSDVRASAQAVGGVVGTPFGSLLDNLAAKSDATAGGTYLVAQLMNGTHYNFADSTTADDGLTADGLFALAAIGGHASTVADIETYLEGEVGSYADPGNSFGGPFSGSLAKLALVAEVTGNDPHAFGDTDLLALLRAKVCTAAIDGDFSPCTAVGDFYNAFSGISQALGVLALQASSSAADHVTVDSPVVKRLLSLQCSDGGFTSALITSGEACTSDVDMTGYAVQALAAVAGTDTDLGKAQHYLEDVQKDSGLFPGTAGDNSNSTGLAAQGLQTLVAALTSPTADPPGPKTIAPITTWQSALTGLHTLVASGGGFGISAANPAADVRATTRPSPPLRSARCCRRAAPRCSRCHATPPPADRVVRRAVGRRAAGRRVAGRRPVVRRLVRGRTVPRCPWPTSSRRHRCHRTDAAALGGAAAAPRRRADHGRPPPPSRCTPVRRLAAMAAALLVGAASVGLTAPPGRRRPDRQLHTRHRHDRRRRLRPLGRADREGCGVDSPTGYQLLIDADFTMAGTQHDGPAFICRIGNPAWAHGLQYPTPSTEPCALTPPASAYWSYWLAPKGQHTWSYSNLGAMSEKPKQGEVELWHFGATNIAGTCGSGVPPYSPDALRPGGAGATGGSGAACSSTKDRKEATSGRQTASTGSSRGGSGTGGGTGTGSKGGGGTSGAHHASGGGGGARAGATSAGVSSAAKRPSSSAAGSSAGAVASGTASSSSPSTAGSGGPTIIDARPASADTTQPSTGSVAPVLLGVTLAVLLAGGAGWTTWRRRRASAG